MDKWVPLSADKLHGSGSNRRSAHLAPSTRRPTVRILGTLPEEAIVVVLQWLSVPDALNLGRCSRRLRALSVDDRVWAQKSRWLCYQGPPVVIKAPERMPQSPPPALRRRPPSFGPKSPNGRPTSSSIVNDDFGDFVQPSAFPKIAPPGRALNGHSPTRSHTVDSFGSTLFDAEPPDLGMNGFAMSEFDGEEIDLSAPAGSKSTKATPTTTTTGIPFAPTKDSELAAFRARYEALLPFLRSLQTHSTSSLLFTDPSLTPLYRAQLIATLSRFFHPSLCAPTDSFTMPAVVRNLQSATDVFEGTLLSEFERCDDARDEEGMKRVARVVWELGHGSMSVVQVFVGKREIFYDTRYNPLENIVRAENLSGTMSDGVDFRPMDRYITHVCETVASEGAAIARIFPAHGEVLVQFIDRVATDVLSEYVATLLNAVQGLGPPLFLLATAAVFTQLLRLVPSALSVEPKSAYVTAHRLEDVIYRMYEAHMDDYLQEEGDWIKEVLQKVCREQGAGGGKVGQQGTSFLATENPAQAKKTVLTSFTKALLLPVTIVPKTVAYSVNAITYVGNEAFNTVAQLGSGFTSSPTPEGYSNARHLSKHQHAKKRSSLVETWLDDDPDEQGPQQLAALTLDVPDAAPNGLLASAPLTRTNSAAPSESGRSVVSLNGVSIDPSSGAAGEPRMQLLLSLDLAVQLIAADREALKRVQTFKGYPGSYGVKVRDTMEEIFIVLLQVLTEQQILPAFARAARHMAAYKTEDHDTEAAVAPLVEFFELVHVGDTVQQMVQAYFDREMAMYIDRTDFLNAVIREKKHFESALDDSVARGLNAGVDILMNQAEHILLTQQDPRDYCPEEEVLDLAPTKACTMVIDCLRTHCNMLKGSTDKQIMEVFHQEVGIRLHGMLCKHFKRGIVSIPGGFQMIADLNTYHAFVASFKQPNLTVYFTALKMVGGLFIITSPKDLGQLARDVHRFDGTLSNEDLYEFVQRRSDWKKIEKQVDREIYGLGKEDCVIA